MSGPVKYFQLFLRMIRVAKSGNDFSCRCCYCYCYLLMQLSGPRETGYALFRDDISFSDRE